MMTHSPSLTHTGCWHGRDGLRTIVAIAWPTGRPIYAYTAEEIAEGVDLYTKAMKARGANPQGGGDA